VTPLALLQTLISVWLALYGLHAFILLFLYLRHRREALPTPSVDWEALPHVTVQVPVYNELHVVERVIDHVSALKYPHDKLHIQVLDDSTDETFWLSCGRAALHRERGVDIAVLQRPDRSGFKAGALRWGLTHTLSEFIAIFDADFCPPPDFLLKTIPHMVENPQVGLVQTRWTYHNADYSPLTEAQALLFDGHFGIEQVARCRSGLFMNFNGTGGVWRRRCIEDAGGWEDDTLCEDLDLSYRAQMAGWKFLYLRDVAVPAELPPQITAFKRQQFRWSQGSAQTLRKLAGPILRSKRLPWKQKALGVLHLSNYLAHALMVLHLLISLPLLLLPHSGRLPIEDFIGLLGLGPPLVFILAQQQLYPADWWRRLRAFPMMMVIAVGIAWCSARAVWRGLTKWGGTFVRTPKFRLEGKDDDWANSCYRLGADSSTVGEIILALYALTATFAAFVTEKYALIPFTLMYAIAFGMVAGMGIAQGRPARQHRPLHSAPALKMAGTDSGSTGGKTRTPRPHSWRG
jgi:cellulose synthase/poly-beta-1,6-N-acetylglucosamine synthase-like glycosyltransferase